MIADNWCWDCGKRDDLAIVEIRYADGDHDTVALCPACRTERRQNRSLIGDSETP
jgi:hypothetical protein